MTTTSTHRACRSMARALLCVGLLATLVGCSPKSPTPGPTTDSVEIGDETVTVEVSAGLTVSVELADVAGLPPAPAGLEFPLGALDIEVDDVAPGGVAVVDVTFSSPVEGVRKLIGGAWDEFAFDGTTGAVLAGDGLSVALHLQDGGRGDADGAANGTIADPLAPVQELAGLQIDGELPVTVTGQPYSHQLLATGATGPLTWSVIGDPLPAGFSLSSSGVLSGVGDPYVWFKLIRVQATDGVSTATRLLVLGTTGTEMAPHATGEPLPDGSSLPVVYSWGCAIDGCDYSLGRYRTDGTLEPVQTLSIDALAELEYHQQRIVSPDRTLVVPRGSTKVLDAVTGELVADLGVEDPQAVAMFSPTGDHLAVSGSNWTFSFYDTTTWEMVRTLPLSSSYAAWNPVGSEILYDGTIYSLVDPSGASDRTVSVPTTCVDREWSWSSGGSEVLDWSATGRLLVRCWSNRDYGSESIELLSVSALDGGDVHVISHDRCSWACYGRYGFFSPSGSFVLMGALGYEYVMTPESDIAVAYAADEHQPERIELFSDPVTGQNVTVSAWR